MKIVKASYEILTPIDRKTFLKTIEIAGRTCYKSKSRITEDSASKFVKMLVNKGHHAMIEHAPSISVKFIVDRGVSHELVRHRLFSFAQESTRYCNYGKNNIQFILPCWFEETCLATEAIQGNHAVNHYNISDMIHELYPAEEIWYRSMLEAENAYKILLEQGWQPQQARSVLPNSLKTEIIVTGNVREWIHFFKMRTASVAYPQMREVAIPLYNELKELLPEIFDGIEVQDT